MTTTMRVPLATWWPKCACNEPPSLTARVDCFVFTDTPWCPKCRAEFVRVPTVIEDKIREDEARRSHAVTSSMSNRIGELCAVIDEAAGMLEVVDASSEEKATAAFLRDAIKR